LSSLHARAARTLLLASALLLCLPAHGLAGAKKRTTSRKQRPHTANRARPESFAAALVVEAETGRVLYEKNQDALRAPASLAKMMTELITLEALERGLVSLRDTLTVPREVRRVGGSRIRLRSGERLPLMEALEAMVISSANDAALAVACHVGGTEAGFLWLMNRRARELGMAHTHYASVHGLDRPGAPGSVTTARDQALLARALLQHPLALTLSSTAGDTIRGGQVIHTTNRLLGKCPGVDGLKTGYTAKAGFCLVSTAQRDGLRLVSVLLGARSNRRRFSESENLLARAYSRYRMVSVIRKGQDLGRSCMILGGTPPQVRLVAGEDVAVLVPAEAAEQIALKVEAPASLRPPVSQGNPVGLLQVLVGDSLAAQAPAVAARDVRQAGLWNRIGFRSAD